MANIKRVNALGITKPGTAISDVPDAPTIGTATSGSGAATVTYTAAATGGTATTFTATSNPGSLTGTGASPITISGLTNGTSYTFTVTASNSTGTSPASSASNSVTPVSLGEMDPIAMVEVGSAGAANITFSSIPSTYTHLQIRFLVRQTSTSSGYSLQMNSDTGSNYYRHYLYATGSGSVSAAATTASSMVLSDGGISTSTTGVFGGAVCDILDYTNTNKYKVIRTLGGYDNNGNGFIALTSGLWLNTAAVTTLTILPDAGNFAQYSSFALYGIKDA
jgi:hypothetical protein